MPAERQGDATVRVVVRVPDAEPVVWRGVSTGDVRLEVPVRLPAGTHTIPVRQVYASGFTENWRPQVVATAKSNDMRNLIVVVAIALVALGAWFVLRRRRRQS